MTDALSTVVEAPVPHQTVMPSGSDGDIVVIARNPQEMAEAQKHLISWVRTKMEKIALQLKETEDNIAVCKVRKLSPKGWENRARLERKSVEFYEKMKAALEAGYCIMPDLPIEIIAIRTTKDVPAKNPTRSDYRYNVPNDQRTNSPALGTGVNVSPQTENVRSESSRLNKEGKSVPIFEMYADAFKDEIDFPLKMVKPQVLDETGRALALKIFDEIGILPATRRNPDPVVVGRIKLKLPGSAWRIKTVAFLITWWVATESL